MPRTTRTEPANARRFQARKAFLTYSQCPIPKEEMLTWLQTFGLEAYIIAEETHQDGGKHLHALVLFKEKLSKRGMGCFDYRGYHPNIAVPKNAQDMRKIASYCRKEGSYIQDGQLYPKTRSDLYAAIVAAGSISRNFIQENPDVLALNYSSITQWLRVLGSGQGARLVRPTLKKRHIWLWGPSNSGKSTWLFNFLGRVSNTQEIPSNNDFQGVDLTTEYLWADEFKGGLSVQALNRLCDGNTKLNTKGGSTSIGHPLVIISSNFSIRDCYPCISDDLYLTLTNRFVEYLSPGNFPSL